jgi:hypothetical protein
MPQTYRETLLQMMITATPEQDVACRYIEQSGMRFLEVVMSDIKYPTLVNPVHDPRLNPVAALPDLGPATEPPAAFYAQPEDAVLRLHMAHDYDPPTDEQMQLLDASEAIHRLIDAHGFDPILRMFNVIAIAHGRKL